MQILPHSDANQGPAEWFTGRVDIQPLKAVSEDSRYSISSVHFRQALVQLGTPIPKAKHYMLTMALVLFKSAVSRCRLLVLVMSFGLNLAKNIGTALQPTVK